MQRENQYTFQLRYTGLKKSVKSKSTKADLSPQNGISLLPQIFKEQIRNPYAHLFFVPYWKQKAIQIAQEIRKRAIKKQQQQSESKSEQNSSEICFNSPTAKEGRKRCSICHIFYKKYFEHIESKYHKTNLRKHDLANAAIKELVSKYTPDKSSASHSSDSSSSFCPLLLTFLNPNDKLKMVSSNSSSPLLASNFFVPPHPPLHSLHPIPPKSIIIADSEYNEGNLELIKQKQEQQLGNYQELEKKEVEVDEKVINKVEESDLKEEKDEEFGMLKDIKQDSLN